MLFLRSILKNCQDMIGLHQLEIGKKALIKKFLREDILLKTLEMGMLPNTEIEITCIAPLGDPICVKVNGTMLSLRKAEASSIQVEVLV